LLLKPDDSARRTGKKEPIRKLLKSLGNIPPEPAKLDFPG
jgi:hypothetical protein